MKRSGIVVLSAFFVILLICITTQAFAGADYSAWNNFYERQSDSSMLNKGGDYSDSSNTAVSLNLGTSSYPAAVTITNPGSYTTMSGYANASTLSLGVSGYAKSLGQNGPLAAASIDTTATNSFTVLPGTSRLSSGDHTTLLLNISLDGSVFTDAQLYPGRGGSSVGMDAGLTIWDPEIFVNMEGIYYPDQAYFGASVDAFTYDLNPDYYSEREDYWRMGSNIVNQTSGNYYWDSENTSGATGGIPVVNPGNYQRALLFDVIVGHTLNVEAYMSTLVQAYGTAEAWCDYDNTFTFSLIPTVEGVQLDWEIPVVQQTNSVPEPATLLLLGLGLVGVVGTARKTKK